jgi:endonuclease YncB( thermonuclease family)
MQIISAFTTRPVLAGAVHSSSDMCLLSPSEVRGPLYFTCTHKYGSNTNNDEKNKNDAGLKGKTIHIRLAGMDAPEVSKTLYQTIPVLSLSLSPPESSFLFQISQSPPSVQYQKENLITFLVVHGRAQSIAELLPSTFNQGGHFGRLAQPHYTEAIAWLKENIEGRRIKCELLKRDQYERVVALPLLPRTFHPWRHFRRWWTPQGSSGSPATATTRNLSLEMIRAGWGVVYTQKGAVYGSGWEKEAYLAAEAEAQSVPFPLLSPDFLFFCFFYFILTRPFGGVRGQGRAEGHVATWHGHRIARGL